MFDNLINNLPLELHLPAPKGEYVLNGSFNNTNKYSFAGPGTKFLARLKEGYKGINDLDKAALEHDAAYHFYKDRDTRNVSDRILAEKALAIAKNTTKNGHERMMAAFVYKVFTEGGLADKLQGKGYELRDRKPVQYSEKKKVKAQKEKPTDTKITDEISKIKFPILAEELHKTARKRFPRRRVIVKNIDETWGMDICFMTDLESDNKGYKYILTIIDCFSKFAWAIPLKTKDAKSVFDAFLQVLNTSGRKPKNIWVDQGSEFYNTIFTKYLKQNKIARYSTYENFHNPIIERFNRTLKTMMWKRFTLENTRNWLDMLESLVHQYNNSKHRSIGMKPIEASNPKNQSNVLQNLYPKSEPKLKKPKFSVGDIVRISRLKEQYEKGFHPNWSEELLKIIKVNDTYPRTYKIEALDGEEVVGSFYEQELQKSKIKENELYNNATYRVEKILKEKKINGKEMVLVKWAGYDNPTWEKRENIIDL